MLSVTILFDRENKIPYQMMFVSFNSNTTGVTCEAGVTIPSRALEFTPGF